MYSSAIRHVSNPQMSNCVSQRMEIRLFERVADRDYSPRVMGVRWSPSFEIVPLLTLPLPGNISSL